MLPGGLPFQPNWRRAGCRGYSRSRPRKQYPRVCLPGSRPPSIFHHLVTAPQLDTVAGSVDLLRAHRVCPFWPNVRPSWRMAGSVRSTATKRLGLRWAQPLLHVAANVGGEVFHRGVVTEFMHARPDPRLHAFADGPVLATDEIPEICGAWRMLRYGSPDGITEQDRELEP